jgi:hypothetical protein
MKNIDTLIFKIKEDIVFPYQRVNISIGKYIDKGKIQNNLSVKYNDCLGLVFKDKNSKIREIGVLAKIIGISKSQIKSVGVLNSSSSHSYVQIYIMGRIKIPNYDKINEIYADSELFVSSVELLEDEISKMKF